MKNLSCFIKKNKWYILIYILFLIIAILTPISGDDWGNYNKFNSIIDLINYSKGFYYSWEGRVVSRFLIGLLTYNKWLWNILLPTLMVALVYFINRFSNSEKKKNIFLLSILTIFIINYVMFAQTYTWIAGSITYLYPSVLIFGYFVFLFTNKKRINFFVAIILLIINIIGTMFVENIGFALVFGNILYLIYYYIYNKKISKLSIFFTIISAIGLYIMLKSPGSAIRMTYDSNFNNLSFFNKILYNKYNFFEYLYNRNIFMVILMCIPIIKILFKKIKNQPLMLITTFVFLLIPMLTLIFNFKLFIPVDFKFELPELKNNFLIIMYWFIFTILYIISIICCNIDKNGKIKCLFLFLISLISLLCLIVTPGYGDRVSFFTILLINTVSLKLISSLNLLEKNKYIIFFRIIVILGILYYFVCFVFIGIFNYKREIYIKKCIQSKDKQIVLKSNPIYLIWNNNPSNEYHLDTFKQYYHIPNDVEVSVAWIKF